MFRIYKSSPDGFGVKVGIVVSRFNEPITYSLLAKTEETLLRRGVKADDLTIAFVPGALEIPQAILKMMRNHEMDAAIALGAVIKGETAHFDYVASESARGITMITTTLEMPVINGILACYDIDQAISRVDKGVEFAESALEMVGLYKMM